MYWQRDTRCKANGGFFYCAIKDCERRRERYDQDPIHRTSKLLKHAAYRRGKTLERMEKAYGALSPKG